MKVVSPDFYLLPFYFFLNLGDEEVDWDLSKSMVEGCASGARPGAHGGDYRHERLSRYQ